MRCLSKAPFYYLIKQVQVLFVKCPPVTSRLNRPEKELPYLSRPRPSEMGTHLAFVLLFLLVLGHGSIRPTGCITSRKFHKRTVEASRWVELDRRNVFVTCAAC